MAEMEEAAAADKKEEIAMADRKALTVSDKRSRRRQTRKGSGGERCRNNSLQEGGG